MLPIILYILEAESRDVLRRTQLDLIESRAPIAAMYLADHGTQLRLKR